MSCLLALTVLRAEFGEEIPYRGGLDRGFAFRGSRVPFLNFQKGIHRASVQRGPAALSIQTSWKSPYSDREIADGFVYSYREGPIDQPDNRALRACAELAVPIVYFVSTRPGWYRPTLPCYVIADDPIAREVIVTVGEMRGPLDDQEPAAVEDPVRRRYAVRETKVRLHQARFRGRVVPAYRNQCAICHLREVRLLDAAHIVGDAEDLGEPAVANGLSLCSIHHRAFDQNLVGVSPDYEVRVSGRLLDEEDGPMLDVLKAFHRGPLTVPRAAASRPDRELLAIRFDQFTKLGG